MKNDKGKTSTKQDEFKRERNPTNSNMMRNK